MNLSTKQYRVSIPGKECRKCTHYKRPRCNLTSTYTWDKAYCEDWEGVEDGYRRIEEGQGGVRPAEEKAGGEGEKDADNAQEG